MNSLNTIQKLSKIGKVLSRIAFILSVIGAGGCAAGLLGLGFGGGAIRLGSVTLHGLVSGGPDGFKGVAAALSGWLVVCAGEAVLARFAEVYFKNELEAGTPFTFSGAKELLRLGILAIAISTGCAAAGSIAEGITAGLLKVEAASMDRYFDGGAGIVLGVLLILGGLLCRYGAELREAGSGSEKEDL